MIETVESLLLGKVPGNQNCEDGIFVCKDFAMVADGATDKTGWSYQGKLGGKIAVETCLEVVSGLPADITFRATVDLLTEKLSTIRSVGPADGPSASLVIISAYRREVWQLGDVSFAIPSQNIQFRNTKEIDKYTSNCRSILLKAHIKQGATIDELRLSDPGREMIKPILNSQYLWRNQPGNWGYGAIDGTPVPDEYLQITSLPPEKVEVIVCSDGYSDIFGDLKSAENALSSLLLSDPLCIGPLLGTKAWKPQNISFDDRAYLKVVL